MCDKAVDTCPFVFEYVPDRYVTQELCDKAVFEEPVMLKYFRGKYKSQEMYDKSVNVSLLALNFVLDWLLRVRYLKTLIVLYFLMMIWSLVI